MPGQTKKVLNCKKGNFFNNRTQNRKREAMLFNVDWSFPRIARVGSTPKGCNRWRERGRQRSWAKKKVFIIVLFLFLVSCDRVINTFYK